MYCINCGNELENDSAFCGFCGAVQPGASAPAARAAEPVTPPAPVEEPAPKAKAKAKAKKPRAEKKPVSVKKLIITCAAVLVVLALLGFGAYSYMTPENVSERFVKYCFTNIDKAAKLLAYDDELYTESSLMEEAPSFETFFDLAGTVYEADITSWEDYYANSNDTRKVNMSDTYGKYRLTTKAGTVKSLSVKSLKQDFAEKIDELERIGAFDGDSIEGAKTVTVTWKIKGDSTIDRGSTTLTLVKTDGTWKVFNSNMYNVVFEKLAAEGEKLKAAENEKAKAAEAAKEAENAEAALAAEAADPAAEAADPAASAAPVEGEAAAADAAALPAAPADTTEA